MNAALGLVLALPPSGPLVFALLDGTMQRLVWDVGTTSTEEHKPCAVPVTDALVSLVEQSIVGNIVLVNVLLDVLEAPVGEGVNLDETRIVNLDDGQIATLSTLALSPSSQHSLDVQLGIRPVCRLNLGEVVIEIVVGLPELLTVPGREILGRLAPLGLVDVEVNGGIPLTDLVDKVKGLLEVVECVEEDEGRLRDAANLGQHVKSDETRESKSCRLEEIRQGHHAPPENFYETVSLKSK